MPDFAKKQKLKRLLYSPIAIILLVLISVGFSKGVYSMYQKYSESKESRQNLEKQIADLAVRKVYLEEELKALSSESGIEKRLRSTFDVKKDGEEVAVIINTKNNESVEDESVVHKKNWIEDHIVSPVAFSP